MNQNDIAGLIDMRLNSSVQNPAAVISLLLLLIGSPPLSAAVAGFPGSGVQWLQDRAGPVDPVLLAGNAKSDRGSVPAPGTLVIPGEDEDRENDTGEKKCMTVCARWGEDCQYIDRGAGGLSKKCRRACQQFTEECF